MSVELHRWVDNDGMEWVCGAYDHGPFCRLCRPVDNDVRRAILENIDAGLIRAVGVGPDGDLLLELTDEGTRQATDLIEHDPKSFSVYMRAKLGEPEPNRG